MRELILDLIASCFNLEILNSFEIKDNKIIVELADGSIATIAAK